MGNLLSKVILSECPSMSLGRGSEGLCMHIYYIPQRIHANIIYSIAGDTVMVTMGEEGDTFDFSALPDGEAAEIISTLDPCPVLSAKRVNGELQVTLLRAIGPRPQPQDYETPEDYQAGLDAWRRLWTDDLEVVIAG